MKEANVGPLPREMASGIFWLGECAETPAFGDIVHSYSSAYLVTGTKDSVLVETGRPSDFPVLDSQLSALLGAGAPAPRYIFLTHTETPHAGAVGYLLERFPEAKACGDVTDLHLVFPEYRNRFLMLDPGARIDLGETEFEIVDAVFRDYGSTRWGFDTARRTLFAGDGFSYAHYHASGQCGHFAEEVPALDLPAVTALFSEAAFYWTKFVNVEPHIEALKALIFDRLSVNFIAPAHGLPISDPGATFAKIADGLRIGSAT
jgi:flavorubredoxin